MSVSRDTAPGAVSAERTTYSILLAISISHCLNDTIQSLIASVYPLLQQNYALNYTQIGLITLAFQLTASVLQPFVGSYTDRRPMPYSLMTGMGLSLAGLVLLAYAHSYAVVLLAAMLIGTGSSVFHPEASRVARMASGGRTGLAQSIFQVGGNFGTALGPLLAAFIVVPFGQTSIAGFSVVALAGMAILFIVGNWYSEHQRRSATAKKVAAKLGGEVLSRNRVITSIAILLALIFSKYFYMAAMGTFYQLYLIHTFGFDQNKPTDVQHVQMIYFVFLFAVAAGTVIGGPVGDRIGRKYVIWISVLGVLPFTLALPYVNLFWTTVLASIIGFILASAFSAIVVYAQELMPGRTGMVAGLFFGFAFGMGGLGAFVLGKLADLTSIAFVYKVCGFLPAIGLLAFFLPNIEGARTKAVKPA